MKYEPYVQRIRWKLEESAKLYSKLVYREVAGIPGAPAGLSPLEGFETLEHFRDVPETGWETAPVCPGRVWGGDSGNLWLRGSFTVPEDAAGEPLFLQCETGAFECFVFVNGEPAGMFNSKDDLYGRGHDAVPLTAGTPAGTVISFAVECYAGHFEAGEGVYQYYDDTEPRDDCRRVFRSLRVCRRSALLAEFSAHLITLASCLRLSADEPFGRLAREHADAILRETILFPKNYSDGEILASAAACEPLFDAFFAEAKALVPDTRFYLTGQSHIDSAWRWPMRETVRKCARTFTEALSLMERFPEYRFTCSAMLHLEWMRVWYPTVFARLQKAAAEGRFELIGGSWVECDCMIPGGEAFARQFLYGQRFAEKYFGKRCSVFWQPDTFGYSSELPQLLSQAGLSGFFSTKLFWNDLNRFPYLSFFWEGLDGSRVKTHFHDFSSHALAPEALRTVREIRELEAPDTSLLLFGQGDGGGGPNEADLLQMRDLVRLADDPEKLRYRPAQSFYEDLTDDLPVYRGELYLETHRGVFTSQHEIKRSNRKCELALHTLELTDVLKKSGLSRGERESLWRTLLQNQFHDILPGSSMNGVTPLAVSENRDVIRKAEALTLKALSSPEGALRFFNPSSFACEGTLPVTADAASFPGYPVFTALDGSEKTLLPAVPAAPFSSADMPAPADAPSPFLYSGEELRTPLYLVRFDPDGSICSLTERRTGRELCRKDAPPLNSFFCGEDVPASYDNWNIDLDTLDKQKRQLGLISSEVILDGAEEFRLRQTRALARRSVLTQDLVFYANNPRVDFETRLDWHDNHQLVKVCFAADVPEGTVRTDVGLGHLVRATGRETSEDLARFEICQHKWTDLSGADFGVTLLNDCKYGISVTDGELRLTLMKAGTHPDDTADEGVHYCLYSFRPHEGAFSVGNAVRPAYELNLPPIPYRGEAVVPFFSFESETVVCETVKTAEDSPAAVLRFYEASGRGGSLRLTLPAGSRLIEANLLEEPGEALDPAAALAFRPFELKTLLVL